MDTYSTLREFADSWFLIAMTAFYVGAILWLFRPGAKKAHDEAANLPFRNEEAPGSGCAKSCPDCACQKTYEFLPREGV